MVSDAADVAGGLAVVGGEEWLGIYRRGAWDVDQRDWSNDRRRSHDGPATGSGRSTGAEGHHARWRRSWTGTASYLFEPLLCPDKRPARNMPWFWGAAGWHWLLRQLRQQLTLGAGRRRQP